jgi:acetyl-CoA carboxylase beta subunit
VGKITVSADQEFSILSAQDRCDKCGSQAYVLVIFENENSLTFCGHHWNQYAEKLIALAIDVVDETDKLNLR